MHTLIKVGIIIRWHLTTRVSTPQMWQMTMTWVFRIPIFLPFLQLSIFSDSHWRNLIPQFIYLLWECFIYTKSSCCGGCVFQQVINHCIIHCYALKHSTALTFTFVICIFPFTRMVFWRYRRTGNHISCHTVLIQKALIEFRRTFHHRIIFCKELLVACIQIMFPYMRAEPSITCRPYSSRNIINSTRGTPQVCIMMQRPPFATIHLLCALFSCLTNILNKLQERQMAFWKIRYLSRPVVHFHINICSVFRIPCRILSSVRIPYALQVCWLRTRLRRWNQQISSELEVHCCKRWIRHGREFLNTSFCILCALLTIIS